MKLLVDRLDETPSAFAFEVSAPWLVERLGPAAQEGVGFEPGGRVEGSVHRMGADLHIEGVLELDLELTCSRCLARYRAPVRERFRLVLEPAGSRVPADPEGAATLAQEGMVLGDELETGWFRGHEIHLDRFIGDLAALALPVQPVCREECRGLCPRCGVDRNVESCDCTEARGASPFAVLASLRGSLGSHGKAGGEDR